MLVIVPLHLMMCAGVFLYFNVLVTAFNTTDELKYKVIFLLNVRKLL